MSSNYDIEKKFKDFIYNLEFKENKKLNTIISIKNDVKQFTEFILLKNIDSLEIIDDLIVREYFLYLKSLNVSVSTYNRKLTSIRKFFKYISELGITKNEILLETEKTSKDKNIEYLNQSEIEKIRKVIYNEKESFNSLRDRLLFELLYSTGLTVAEVLLLGEINFNLDKNEIYILKNQIKRIVYFSYTCKNCYLKFLEIKKEKFKDENNSNIIFINNSNVRLTDRSVRRIINKYSEKTGLLKEISPYTIRHTFCIHMLRNGMPKEYLAKLLGIKVVSILDTYENIIKKENLWQEKNV